VTGIRLEHLTRRYGDREVVSDLCLEVASGERFGFVGPNGSGKSTTIRMLTTLLPPSSGKAFVGPDEISDVWAVRRRIGVVFQDPSLDLRLTARENLDYYLALYRVDLRAAERRVRVTEALANVDLASRSEDLVGSYSWGMRRRLEIARALMPEPQVLFLDEPTTGLDPQSRQDLWLHLERLGDERGITLFVATHDMEEAARCQRVAVLDKGRLVAVDTPAGLGERTGTADLTAAFLSLTGRVVPSEAASGTLLPKGRDGMAYRRG
jgi:ABC-2 type transport system ATP-binding protein